MPFHSSEARAGKQLTPGVDARTFWGERMLLSLVDLVPGAVIPEHSHPHEQIGTMLAGTLAFTIADETRTVRPGDVWVIPGDAPHTAVAGEQGARVVEVFSPVREEYKY
jgi:quercetin dioxygenase-like cupin family protein